MIPGIVIGIATLIALVTLFDVVNPVLAALWPAVLGAAPRLQLGLVSLIAAHTLFTMALAILIVRARLDGMDRSLVEASMDLYAPPFATFRQITLPQLMPAIVASFLLAFTFSFDDFVIAFFVAGPNTTLPIYVFASIRRGVTPEINAIGTMVLAVSLTVMVAAQLLLRSRRPGQCGVIRYMSAKYRRRCRRQQRRASTGGTTTAASNAAKPGTISVGVGQGVPTERHARWDDQDRADDGTENGAR